MKLLGRRLLVLAALIASAGCATGMGSLKLEPSNGCSYAAAPQEFGRCMPWIPAPAERWNQAPPWSSAVSPHLL